MSDLATTLSNLQRNDLLERWKHVLALAKDIKSWTSDGELAWLCDVASRSTSICEIGSFHGKSALCLAMGGVTAHIDCIDICDHQEVEETFSNNLAGPIAEGRLKFFRGTSDILKDKPVSYDLAWIDAGHLFHDVKGDINNVIRKMRAGAIICGHDWRVNDMSDGVNQAVMDAFGTPNTFESIWWVQLP